MNLLIPYRIIGKHISDSQGFFYAMELVTIGNNHVNNTMPHTWKVPGGSSLLLSCRLGKCCTQAQFIQNRVGSEENGEDGQPQNTNVCDYNSLF